MDTLFPFHEHDKAVETRCDAAVRRSAELKCAHEKTERFLRALFAVADDFKNAFLQFGIVDTHGTGCKLVAVEHQIVEIAFDGTRIALERIPIFFLRKRKHVVFRFPLALVFVPRKIRKIDNPHKVKPITGIIEAELFTELLAHGTECDAGGLPSFVAYKQKQIVFFGAELFANLFFFARVEFRDAAFERTRTVDFHPREPLRFIRLCNRFERFDHFPAVLVGDVFDDERFYRRAFVPFDIAP